MMSHAAHRWSIVGFCPLSSIPSFHRVRLPRLGFALSSSPSLFSLLIFRNRRISSSIMSAEKGRPLPKFGEWDVNNPASAEGFTVIFNKARDDKKTNANPAAMAAPPRNNNIGAYKPQENYDFQPESRNWFCCV